MFILEKEELENWRCQFGISKEVRMGLRYAPMAFTEHGVLMLSSVLKSKRSIEINIAIMRVFVRLRRVISENTELLKKVAQLEQKFGKHDKEIQVMFNLIKRLMTEPDSPKKRVGF